MSQFKFEIDEAGLAQMGETMQEVVNEFATKIAGSARGEAPVLSGGLRDSIGAKLNHEKLVALVIADAPHAGLVHNGTSSGPNHPFTTKANPFVKRAAEANYENVRPRSE